MILTLTRDNTATKGLIVAQTNESSLTSLRCYKPGELEELSLVELTDGSIEVSMKIGQKAYNVTTDGVNGLVINGVDQVGQTAAQISDTLSLLFLESTGGGGGTTDNTTPPYLPFKSVSNTFEDSTLFHSIEPAVDEFALDGGKEEVSFQIKNDNVNGIKKIKFGNTQPVVSPYDHVYFEIDFLALFITMVCDEILLGGDVATGAAHIKTEQTNKVVKLGDIFANNAGSKIIIDDTIGIIDLSPNNRAGGVFLELDAGNQNTVLSGSSKMKIKTEIVDQLIKIGDADNAGNGNLITVDDSATNEILIYSNNQVRIITALSAVLNSLEIHIKAEGDSLYIGNANAGHKTYFKNYTAAADTLINIQQLPVYADNAAAILGGLVAGDLYRAAASNPGFVCIVY